MVAYYLVLCNLREVRDSQGLSRRALSELSGVSERAIKYAEEGRDVRVSTALALADALGVSVSDLVEAA